MRSIVALTLVLAAGICRVVQAQTYDTNNVMVDNFVGSGFYGHVDGQGELTMFYNPGAVVADSVGNLFVLDEGNNVMRKVTTNGVVTTFVGGGQASPPGYGTNVYLGYSYGIRRMVIDDSNQIWIASSSSSLLRVSPDALVLPISWPSGQTINGICIDSANRLYLACSDNRIYRYETNLVFSVFVGSGNPGAVDGNWIFNSFSNPSAMVADAADNLYVWDSGNYLIRRVNQNRDVTTIAGRKGYSNDADGTGTNAAFASIGSMCVGIQGDVFLTTASSYYGHGGAIRRMSPSFAVTTVAGSFSEEGYVNGAGPAARFDSPTGIVCLGGRLFVSDSANHRIRRILFDAIPQPVPDGQLILQTFAGLHIHGTIGRSYHIESSIDMTNWTSEATLQLPSDPYLWMDPMPMGQQKFYRAFLLP